MNKPMEITVEQATEMVKEYCDNNKLLPYGLYYFKEQGKFIAIANESGDCFMEAFEDKDNCIRYLLGEEAVDCCGVRHNVFE